MKKGLKKIIEDYRKKEAIIDKHRIEYHTQVGKALGYPDCCIKQFCQEYNNGITSAYHRIKKYKLPDPGIFKLEYVPCDKCAEKLLKKLGIDF